jgi:hypothetical protein
MRLKYNWVKIDFEWFKENFEDPIYEVYIPAKDKKTDDYIYGSYFAAKKRWTEQGLSNWPLDIDKFEDGELWVAGKKKNFGTMANFKKFVRHIMKTGTPIMDKKGRYIDPYFL